MFAVKTDDGVMMNPEFLGACQSAAPAVMTRPQPQSNKDNQLDIQSFRKTLSLGFAQKKQSWQRSIFSVTLTKSKQSVFCFQL